MLSLLSIALGLLSSWLPQIGALHMQNMSRRQLDMKPEPTDQDKMGTASYNAKGYMDQVSGNHVQQFVKRMSAPKPFPSNDIPDDVVRYNPSVIELPRTLAVALHPQARYAAAFRQTPPGFVGSSTGQCQKFGLHNQTASSGISVHILNDKMQTLLQAKVRVRNDHTTNHTGRVQQDIKDSINDTIADSYKPGKIHSDVVDAYRGEDQLLLGKDPRLFAYGNKVLITVKMPKRCRAQELHFNLDSPGQVSAFVVRDSTAYDFRGQNIGLLNSGGSLYALLWISPNVTTSEIGDPFKTRQLIQQDRQLIQQDNGRKPLHNNINPIPLKVNGTDLFLGIAHEHDKVDGRNLYYRNYFVLFERKPPFRTKTVSSGFCIPSEYNSTKCEAIQFITSALNVEEQLILTYGVNDCQSRMVSVSMDAVNKFMKESSLVNESSIGDHPALAEGRQLLEPNHSDTSTLGWSPDFWSYIL